MLMPSESLKEVRFLVRARSAEGEDDEDMLSARRIAWIGANAELERRSTYPLGAESRIDRRAHAAQSDDADAESSDQTRE